MKHSAVKTIALMRRELRLAYRRVPGGVLWAFAEPVLMVTLLSIGFSMVLRAPPLGMDFSLFFASGQAVFLVFQMMTDGLGNGFRFLKRRGRRWWPEALLARGLIQAIISLTVACVLFIGGLMWAQAHSMIDALQIMIALGMALAFGTAFGVLNCALFAILPIYRPIWSVLARVAFLGSGVLFLPQNLPPGLADILWFHPMLHIISLMRKGLYAGYHPAVLDPLYVAFVSLAAMALGLVLLRVGHPVVRAADKTAL